MWVKLGAGDLLLETLLVDCPLLLKGLLLMLDVGEGVTVDQAIDSWSLLLLLGVPSFLNLKIAKKYEKKNAKMDKIVQRE